MTPPTKYAAALAYLAECGEAWRDARLAEEHARHAEQHAAGLAKDAIRAAGHTHGVSEAEIAAVAKVDRDTVRRVLSRTGPKHAPMPVEPADG